MPKNPWLSIALADYEAHMAHPAVGQAQLLADVLEQIVLGQQPHSLALVGCAGGNGLARIHPMPQRIIAIDIHPEYAAITRARFAASLPGLEVLCADIESPHLMFGPVDLLYVALVLEHVEMAPAFATLRRNCRPGGRLECLIEIEQPGHRAVSSTPYEALQALAGHMRLRSARAVSEQARAASFEPTAERTLHLPTGKRFEHLSFEARR